MSRGIIPDIEAVEVEEEKTYEDVNQIEDEYESLGCLRPRLRSWSISVSVTVSNI